MLSLLTQERPKTSDLDDLVLDAYIFSSQAEAQEGCLVIFIYKIYIIFLNSLYFSYGLQKILFVKI